jgi:16S rRNA processing protein RimM
MPDYKPPQNKPTQPPTQSEENSSPVRTPIGKIVGAFGLRGQLKIEPLTSFLSRFEKGEIVFLDGNKHKIQSSQIHKGRPLIKLAGIDTMTHAEQQQWKILEAEGEVELNEDEFLVEDLIGLKVVTLEGETLGTVEDIEDYPAHEVILVNGIRIPFIEQFVEEINFEEETITVRLIYGMKPGEE